MDIAHEYRGEMTGRLTHSTRVETWECDFNGHWNTRFYARAFQEASERAALFAGGGNPGASLLKSRHMRFHGELLAGDTGEIRSYCIAGGDFGGAVVHLLTSEDALSATAIDFPGIGSAHLPGIASQDLAHALPRGIGEFDPGLWELDPANGIVSEVGVVRAADLDHRGCILLDVLIRRSSHASHDLVAGLGITPQFTKETGIGRMLVELRVHYGESPEAGTLMQAISRLDELSERAISTVHCLKAVGGAPVALVEMKMLAVDMHARRVGRFPAALLASCE